MSVAHVDRGDNQAAHPALRIVELEVDPPGRIPARHEIDARFLGYLGGAAIALLSVLALLGSIPPDVRAIYSDSLSGETHLARGAEPDRLLSGGGARLATVREPDVAPSKSGRRAGKPALERGEAAPVDARRAGILSVLADERGRLTALTDSGAFRESHTLMGDQVGEVAGAFGISLRGVADEGDGSGWNTIGTGRYGLEANGPGTGRGYCGPCPGTRGGLHGRAAGVPSVRVGATRAIGDLDKNVIRRYIRRQLPRIKHCYERALQVDRALAGTLTTHFQISSTGRVMGATAGGVDPGVADCVRDVIASIRFPASDGAGFVDVTYPFIFQAAG